MSNSTPQTNNALPVTNKPNEQGKVLMQDYFRILDPKSKEILVKGRG